MIRRTSQRPGTADRGADILRAAREELARADAKATTLFAIAGVAVSAVLGGVISGQWSPTRLQGDLAQWTWWTGTVATAVALVCLGAAVYPRTRRRGRDPRVTAYYGDVRRRSRAELARSLARDPESAIVVDQVFEVSQIVERKYALIKIAFCATGLGALFCATSVVLSLWGSVR